MARFKKLPNVHQVTIDEYLKSQEELFPDGSPAPPPSPYTQPWRVSTRASAPVFLGAVDGIGSSPAPPAPVPVVFSRFRKQHS